MELLQILQAILKILHSYKHDSTYRRLRAGAWATININMLALSAISAVLVFTQVKIWAH